MTLVEFAREELRLAGLFDKDSDYGGMIGDAVMKMVEQFAGEGHSGTSAALTISIFEKVSRYLPLTPLTGADEEWFDPMGDGRCLQNTRCPHVFKEAGRAYDIQGRIFREPSGACFTSIDSRVDVTFPYTPTSEYVDVPA